MTNQTGYDIAKVYASITHALPETVHMSEYKHELTEFYSSLRTWINEYKKQVVAFKNDLCIKTAQTLQGNLSEFLTLPLRSDADHMKKIMIEQLHELIDIPSLENNLMNITGYKYYHPQITSTTIKKLYTDYVTQTKKNLNLKTTFHTIIETWLSFTNITSFNNLQKYIHTELRDKYQRLFCTVGLPRITLYFVEREPTQVLFDHRYIVKLQAKPSLLTVAEQDSISNEYLFEELSSFGWRHMKTYILPSHQTEDIYLFEFHDREELHRFRSTIHNIHLSKSKKPSKLKMLSIAEFERLDDTEIL